MRIGCCASVDNIKAVREAGYDFVEMPVFIVKPESPASDFEPVRDLIHEAQIVPEAWNCLLAPDMKIVGPEVDMYRIERYLRTAFQRVGELGGEIVVFGSGAARAVPDGFPTDEARQQLKDFLALCGQTAGGQGITVCVEHLNRSETNTINTVQEALELVSEVNHPFVKLLADLHHLVMENEPMAHIVEAREELMHVHIADTGRKQPGSGQYPSAHLFETLRKIGYTERVSIECGWGDFAKECAGSLEFLRSLASA